MTTDFISRQSLEEAIQREREKWDEELRKFLDSEIRSWRKFGNEDRVVAYQTIRYVMVGSYLKEGE